MGVYGIAVLGFFSCGISVILILTCGIAVQYAKKNTVRHKSQEKLISRSL